MNPGVFLLFVAFLSGAIVMGLEIAAARVLAPVFGSSLYVWGSLIGLILLALSVGYYLGGRLADRSNSKIVFQLIFAASVLVSLIPLISWPVMRVFSGNLISGVMISIIILFAVPMALLAAVSPLVIKLTTTHIRGVGRNAGLVYAVSTTGSILGTFVTAFALVPAIGSKETIFVFAATLLLISIIGFGTKVQRKHAAAVVLLMFLIFIQGSVTTDAIYETESIYNTVKVKKLGMTTYLILNSDRWAQSINETGRGYWRFFSLAPHLTETKNVLMLGMGAGTALKQMRGRIDAVEIDPKVVEAAGKYFGIKENENLSVFVDDGRTFLTTAGKYDAIITDAFQGGPDLPFYFATREFFSLLKEHLSDNGIVMLNVLAYNARMELANAVASTIKAEFPSVFIIDGGVNQILIATKQKLSMEEIRNRLAAAQSEPAATALQSIREFSGGGIVLTDNFAPVERMIFEMIN